MGGWLSAILKLRTLRTGAADWTARFRGGGGGVWLWAIWNRRRLGPGAAAGPAGWGGGGGLGGKCGGGGRGGGGGRKLPGGTWRMARRANGAMSPNMFMDPSGAPKPPPRPADN